MKDIAVFVLDKSVNETLFQNLYLRVIGDLKKTWKCEEEKDMKNKQNCFFGYLISLAMKKIEGKHRWAESIDPETIKASSRNELEMKLEESESERLAKKKVSIGTISLVAGVYLMNITGPTYIINALNTLMQSSSAENVEMACVAMKSIYQKLCDNSKTAYAGSIYQYLEKNRKEHGVRMELLIEGTLEFMKPASSGSNNRF